MQRATAAAEEEEEEDNHDDDDDDNNGDEDDDDDVDNDANDDDDDEREGEGEGGKRWHDWKTSVGMSGVPPQETPRYNGKHTPEMACGIIFPFKKKQRVCAETSASTTI